MVTPAVPLIGVCWRASHLSSSPCRAGSFLLVILHFGPARCSSIIEASRRHTSSAQRGRPLEKMLVRKRTRASSRVPLSPGLKWASAAPYQAIRRLTK